MVGRRKKKYSSSLPRKKKGFIRAKNVEKRARYWKNAKKLKVISLVAKNLSLENEDKRENDIKWAWRKKTATGSKAGD